MDFMKKHGYYWIVITLIVVASTYVPHAPSTGLKMQIMTANSMEAESRLDDECRVTTYKTYTSRGIVNIYDCQPVKEVK